MHSGYRRRLADAPIGGHRVVIRLAVRRFSCGNAHCAAVTFAGQIGGLTSRQARRTMPLGGCLGRPGRRPAGQRR